MNADEPIAVSQAEWDEVHACTFCSECELMVGCQTEPNFGCQAEEKKRRGENRGRRKWVTDKDQPAATKQRNHTAKADRGSVASP